MIEYYAHHIYPPIASALSYIAALFPFSLSAIVLLLAALFYLSKLVSAIRQKRGIRCFLIRLLLPPFLALSWMYATWGILYFRDNWYQRTGIDKATPDSTAYTRFLDLYIENLNRSFAQSLTSSLRTPTPRLSDSLAVDSLAVDSLSSDPIAIGWWKSRQAREVDAIIEQSYSRIATYLGIAYPNGKRRPKKVFINEYYTRTSILGYFLPFFHEIHLNPQQPWLQYPGALAHEKAHQFGITSEAECNFYGYLVCIESDNPFVQYSGYFSVLGYIASDARRILPATWRTYLGKIDPRILRESAQISAYWRSHRHEKLSRIQNKVYDTYLKANRIPTGIENYGEVTALLLTHSVSPDH